MKKKVLLALFVAIGFAFAPMNQVEAQAKSAFYTEFLGNGLIFSANYDMRFSQGKPFGGRVGIGYVGGGEEGIITVPVMVNALLGKDDGKYFEVGGGITYISGTADFGDLESNIIGTLSFQYRKQPIDGGFMWKIGLTPIFADGVFIPWWPGVSLGYSW